MKEISNQLKLFIDNINEDLFSVDEDFISFKEFKNHYYKHVCGEDEPFTGEKSSNGRIKFPYMRLPSYGHRANEFLAIKVDGGSDVALTSNNCIGWKTKLGWFRGEVFIKFRLSTIKECRELGLIEYIAYKSEYGDEEITINGSNYSYTRYNVKKRLVISYGLCDTTIPSELSGLFRVEDEMPKHEKELTESGYIRLPHQYLSEANRQQLLQKSRNAQHYKNMSKGKNRYERRMKSKISATVRDYNNIDMDALFKRDILEIKIPVMGETDVYEVDVKVDGLLREVQRQVLSNKGKLEFKIILQSLMKVLNVGNVFIGCSCPDAKYRMAYNQTKNGYKAGYRETRPSNKTNPNDTLGAGCKHVMLILANLDWCVKVASVVNNYIKYCQENLEQLYADYIFPKVYGIRYQKAVQMSLFHDGMLPNDRETMDRVIQQGMQGKDKRGKFVKNNPYAFKKREMNQPEEDPNQLKLNFDEEPTEKELKVN